MQGSSPKVLYWLTLGSGGVECLCFAGVLFGYASLVFVFKEERYFSQLCADGAVDNRTECSGQDEQLSLVFTVASFLHNFLTLINGYIFDRFGTLVTRLLGICLYTAGSLLVAFSSAELSELLFPALSCIAVGGVLLLLTNMQVGNLFGGHRSTIITVYNGAYDSSSAVFLIIKLLHERGVCLRWSFLFLSSCSLLHLLRTFLLLPRSHLPHTPPPGYTYGLRCSQGASYELDEARGAATATQDTPPPAEGEESAKGASFRSCVCSWGMLWQVLWLSIMQLRHYLFIGTLNPRLSRLAQGDAALVSRYTNAFAFTQLCGLVCAPWNGLIMDRHKGRTLAPGESEEEAGLGSCVLSAALTSAQCLAFSVCASLPLLPLQYLTFALQVLNRSFLYGGNAAFISVAFPARHFGKVYGLSLSLSALVSLLQFPCLSLVKGALGGDPFPVDVALTVLTLLTFVHPVYVWIRCRRLRRLRKGSAQTPAGPASSTDCPLPQAMSLSQALPLS